ncbi:MAG: hypothetical protein ACJ8J0_08135 [Longimicrobiaceae bacterium]
MANPLSLFMPVIPGTTAQQIATTMSTNQAALDAALASIGTVHYARTLFIDTSAANLQPSTTGTGPYVIGIITEYDGNFDAYIQDFVNKVGPEFDAMLQFVVGGQALIPVANNVNAFTQFIAANDASQHAPNTGLYQAYPDVTVQQILAAFPS